MGEASAALGEGSGEGRGATAQLTRTTLRRVQLKVLSKRSSRMPRMRASSTPRRSPQRSTPVRLWNAPAAYISPP